MLMSRGCALAVPPITGYAEGFWLVNRVWLARGAARGHGPPGRPGLQPYSRGRDGSVVPGDVITAINDEPVANIDDMLTALEKRQPGETVQLSVWRAGKQRKAAAVLAGGD